LNNCFENLKFSRNLIIGWGSWPADNIVAKDVSAAGLAKLAEEEKHYALCQKKDENSACKKVSPAIRSGSDGKDIGADVEEIIRATKGVR
jgi:hypothetical protein